MLKFDAKKQAEALTNISNGNIEYICKVHDLANILTKINVKSRGNKNIFYPDLFWDIW